MNCVGSDTAEQRMIFHFRECVLSVRRGDGKHFHHVSRRRPVARKGSSAYAREITEWLDHSANLQNLIVVGDGPGDVLFCRHLRAELSSRGATISVFGLFIDHDDYGQARENIAGSDFFLNWSDLAVRLAALSDRAGGTALLLDVDRTTIYPRKLLDAAFYSVRSESVSRYVQKFCTRELAPADLQQIIKLVEFLSENFFSYRSTTDQICFKNEESVAISTLLCATGLISIQWLKNDRTRLSSWVNFSSRQVDGGVWASGLGEEEKDGSEHWHKAALQQHLREISDNVAERAPILSKAYREIEASVINASCLKQQGFYNEVLLNAVSSCPSLSVYYLSDRPALSLGISGKDGKRSISELRKLPAISGLVERIIFDE